MVDNCYNCGNKGNPYREMDNNSVYCGYFMGSLMPNEAEREGRTCWVPEE